MKPDYKPEEVEIVDNSTCPVCHVWLMHCRNLSCDHLYFQSVTSELLWNPWYISKVLSRFWP